MRYSFFLQNWERLSTTPQDDLESDTSHSQRNNWKENGLLQSKKRHIDGRVDVVYSADGTLLRLYHTPAQYVYNTFVTDQTELTCELFTPLSPKTGWVQRFST
jgi:hypothetical protein